MHPAHCPVAFFVPHTLILAGELDGSLQRLQMRRVEDKAVWPAGQGPAK
jgi:hypothetical protein